MSAAAPTPKHRLTPRKQCFPEPLTTSKAGNVSSGAPDLTDPTRNNEGVLAPQHAGQRSRRPRPDGVTDFPIFRYRSPRTSKQPKRPSGTDQ